jgi:hypothetical protein
MIRIIMIGFWACLATLAAGYAMTHVRAMQAKPGFAAADAGQLHELRKTKEIDVPKIRDGVVKGYIVAQFSYDLDNAAKAAPISPEALIVDEAFQYIFSDPEIDFDHLESFNLKKMTDALTKAVNSRLNAEVVTSIGIQEFNFLTANQAKKQL